jgi:hypothetical protein
MIAGTGVAGADMEGGGFGSIRCREAQLLPEEVRPVRGRRVRRVYQVKLRLGEQRQPRLSGERVGRSRQDLLPSAPSSGAEATSFGLTAARAILAGPRPGGWSPQLQTVTRSWGQSASHDPAISAAFAFAPSPLQM